MTRKSWSADDEDELDPRRPEWPATRRKVEDYSPDPADWLAPHHMSATETSLRLARWLLARRLVVSDIDVALTGYELTRRDIPCFPVQRFLAKRSVTRLDAGAGDDWRGRYLLRGVIGRAITFEHYEPSDWGAAVVPRNARFRQLASRWRRTQLMERSGLLILTVDCVGMVDGFPPS